MILLFLCNKHTKCVRGFKLLSDKEKPVNDVRAKPNNTKSITINRCAFLKYFKRYRSLRILVWNSKCKKAFCVRKQNLISTQFPRRCVQQHSWAGRKCPRGHFYQQINTRPSSNGKRRVLRVRLSFQKRPVKEFSRVHRWTRNFPETSQKGSIITGGAGPGRLQMKRLIEGGWGSNKLIWDKNIGYSVCSIIEFIWITR